MQVTLVEPNTVHHSCILSNGVITGDFDMPRITLRYDRLKQRHGVKLRRGTAIDIDIVSRPLTVRTGSRTFTLDYDKLVVSPGIDFIPPAGEYDDVVTSHA